MASQAPTPPSAPPYNRLSQTFTPPPPPPKPLSNASPSRQGTPNPGFQALENRPSPPTPVPNQSQHQQQQQIEEPGPNWLPKILENKSTQDLKDILSTPSLLRSLALAPSTAHACTASSISAVQSQLQSNIELTTHVQTTESQLIQQRHDTQTLLLSTRALERQWRAKQAEMDRVLAGFSPGSLYQRLGGSVGESEGVGRSLEDALIDGTLEGGEGKMGEREVQEWVRRYREERKTYWKRVEGKGRWDEGRVGGWR